MRIEDAIIEGQKHLHKEQVRLLLSGLIGCNPLELLTRLKEELPLDVEEKYLNSIEALKNNYPVQYVLGKINFYGYDFSINENVLIPRFETEELVDQTLRYIEQYFKDPIKVIDLGCGSGVIGLSLKKERSSLDVTLLDISSKALEVAAKNAQALNIEVTLCEGDMLNDHHGQYDVIISNPPYIKEDEEVDDVVKKHEPHIALYGGQDGLKYYREILKEVSNHTGDRYLLAFEIGCYEQEEVIDLINEYLADVNIITKQDMSGRNRMIFVMHNLV